MTKNKFKVQISIKVVIVEYKSTVDVQVYVQEWTFIVEVTWPGIYCATLKIKFNNFSIIICN